MASSLPDSLSSAFFFRRSQFSVINRYLNARNGANRAQLLNGYARCWHNRILCPNLGTIAREPSANIESAYFLHKTSIKVVVLLWWPKHVPKRVINMQSCCYYTFYDVLIAVFYNVAFNSMMTI